VIKRNAGVFLAAMGAAVLAKVGAPSQNKLSNHGVAQILWSRMLRLTFLLPKCDGSIAAGDRART